MNNKTLITAGILGILCIMLISGCTDNTSNKSPGTSPEIKTPPAAEPSVQAGNETPAGENAQETETKPETPAVPDEPAESETGNQNGTIAVTPEENKTVTPEENKTVTPVPAETVKKTPAEEKFNPILECGKNRMELTVGNNNSYDYNGCELMVNDVGAAVDKYYFYNKGYTFKISSMYPGNTLDASQFKSARGDPLNDVIYSYTIACYEGTKAGVCV